MRPQHITAENLSVIGRGLRLQVASMRPQHITAENASLPCPSGRWRRGFNEAAAYHCGKPAVDLTADDLRRRLQ